MNSKQEKVHLMVSIFVKEKVHIHKNEDINTLKIAICLASASVISNLGNLTDFQLPHERNPCPVPMSVRRYVRHLHSCSPLIPTNAVTASQNNFLKWPICLRDQGQTPKHGSERSFMLWCLLSTPASSHPPLSLEVAATVTTQEKALSFGKKGSKSLTLVNIIVHIEKI